MLLAKLFVEQMVLGAVVGVAGGMLLLAFMRRVPLPSAGLYALRVLFGAMGRELTGSQRVLPKRLLESGFEFRTPDAPAALRAALESRARIGE